MMNMEASRKKDRMTRLKISEICQCKKRCNENRNSEDPLVSKLFSFTYPRKDANSCVILQMITRYETEKYEHITNLPLTAIVSPFPDLQSQGSKTRIFASWSKPSFCCWSTQRCTMFLGCCLQFNLPRQYA